MSSQSERAAGTEVSFHSGDLFDVIFVIYNGTELTEVRLGF